jgi:hypothetical protein
MSRRALIVLLPFVVAALTLVGSALGGDPEDDTTPPVITPSHVTGWYQNGVNLFWEVTDDQSGIDPATVSGCAPQSVETETAGIDFTCQATNNAGLTSSVTVTIRVDLSDPTLTVSDLGPLPAEGPGGTLVSSYGGSVSATDPPFGPPPVSCNPPAPHTFPEGSTTSVTCTATDASGRSSAPQSFDVIVSPFAPPNTPPVLNVPASITREATGPTGAVVTYSASATDAEDDPDPPAICDPASGSVFPLGTTLVNCTATDSGGLSATPASFNVIVQDTIKPVVTITITSDNAADGPQGAILTYAVSAVDTVDAAPGIDCGASPPSGASVQVGITVTIACQATDTSGNVGSASLTFTAQDPAAPVVTVPASKTVEANGPDGAVVTYEQPTATDLVDGPIPASDISCNRPSGATFPLGTTLVTCSATDSQGNVGGASFTITVVDTTPPVLTAPANLAIQSTTALPASDPRVKAFLESATATDIADLSPEITTNAPGTFPVGNTTVVFTAEDDAGNRAEKSAVLTVTPDPVGGQPGPDTTPPANVTNVRAIVGNLSVSISWRLPKDADRVQVFQSSQSVGRDELGVPAGNGEGELIYEGKKTSLVVKRLTKDLEYRFVIVALDKADNRAAGVAVVAVAQEQTLLSPANGAVLTSAPLVRWKPVPRARYYNAQVWFEPRAGRAPLAAVALRKVLSVWPAKASFKMKKSWRFGGKKHTLKPGRYVLYVFPGIGPKSAGKYGKLHVQAEFTIRR